MDYKELFALVKGMLLGTLNGEPADSGSLALAILRTEVAIDDAITTGQPVGELESMRSELMALHKAVWYAHRGE